jgi:pimeloyl-ACP methyl ester carboxylesterase
MLTKILNIKTHYELIGEGRDTILFLHGWGGSVESLRPLAEQFASTHTCVVVDLPGFGATANPPPEWGTHEYAEYIKQFIDEAKLPKPLSIVGHSFGGSLALCLAAMHPEYVKRLVLCAPSWHRLKSVGAASSGKIASSSLLAMTNSINVIKGHFKRILHFVISSLPRNRLLRKIIYKIFFPQSDLMKYPQLESNFKRIVTEDLTDVTKTVRQPTLILWGDKDTYTPIENAELLQNLIPGALLGVFPAVGHDLPLKHTDLIVESIRSFLR